MNRRIVVLAVGIGLVLAPVAFQMFTRAPKGATMLNNFESYMTNERLDRFDGYLGEIRAAHAQSPRNPRLTNWIEQYPSIDRDLSSMLDSIKANLDNYAAIRALPPFVLFPWFFVIPGLVLVALKRKRWAVIALGIGLIAAPAVFQMFTRAPLGAEMINDFRPIMREERVQGLQQKFLVIASAEGVLRQEVLPNKSLPAVETFVLDWPEISREMAPMIGAISDNIGNFNAVAALPPFWLFPWFFVAPGLIVIAANIRRKDLAGEKEPIQITEEVSA